MSYYTFETCEDILCVADEEVGPYSLDAEYIRLRAILSATPDVLNALDSLLLWAKTIDGPLKEQKKAVVIGAAEAAYLKATGKTHR